MKSLSLHIAYLLLTCREVTVPGLGSFAAIYQQAAFDASDGVFYPSRVRIKFSPKQNYSSPLLQESLERKLQIKSLEAKKLIREFVADVVEKLNKNKYCRLEGLGYLINNRGILSIKDTFWKSKRNNPLKLDVYLIG